MNPVRFGLIGYGLFGKHHAAAITNASQAELVAIAVRSAGSQESARRDHPAVVVLEDYQRLLDQEDVEAVSIVAPNRMHFEMAQAALLADKHVLLEKPMALSVDHCRRLIQLAKDRQRTLAIGHELRLSSLWGGVRQLIERGAIGKPLHALIELSRFPYRSGSEGWRYNSELVGSWVLEEPIHFFDLARWYLNDAGEPASIYARANSRHADQPDLTDNFSAIVNFAGGAYAVVSQTLAAFGHYQTAKISGTKGTIWAWWSAADARSDRPTFGLKYGLGNDVQEVQLDKPAGELLELAEEIEAVAEAIRQRTRPPCTGDDGLWSTWLCLAAEQSVRTGLVASLDRDPIDD